MVNDNNYQFYSNKTGIQLQHLCVAYQVLIAAPDFGIFGIPSWLTGDGTVTIPYRETRYFRYRYRYECTLPVSYCIGLGFRVSCRSLVLTEPVYFRSGHEIKSYRCMYVDTQKQYLKQTLLCNRNFGCSWEKFFQFHCDDLSVFSIFLT